MFERNKEDAALTPQEWFEFGFAKATTSCVVCYFHRLKTQGREEADQFLADMLEKYNTEEKQILEKILDKEEIGDR